MSDSALPAFAADTVYTWTGTAGDGKWSTPSNWDINLGSLKGGSESQRRGGGWSFSGVSRAETHGRDLLLSL